MNFVDSAASSGNNPAPPVQKCVLRKADLFESCVSDSEISEADNLDALKSAVDKCRKCSLGNLRKNAVFGEGNPEAGLMFIGEAPGSEEDLRGRPFVGRAGQLLTDIITKGMGLRREDVFIANILKCRPPENRNPLPEEIICCEPYLLKQIEFIKPKVICALGNFAAQTLLKTREGITKIRGRFFDYRGIKLMPTFHPAYLLRNYSRKNREYVWEDVKKILDEI
ncbi:MAG: uracil-DNA glycosylase [Candidatus Aureabacteria bacterium]|nr:uracil-DNA glycosylase [Candidatus Auribacterota bacterium]